MLKLKVIKNHIGKDNCWTQPRKIELHVGDILEARSPHSNNSGDLFFTLNGDPDNSVMPSSIKTRHPYDEGLIDSEYLETIAS